MPRSLTGLKRTDSDRFPLALNIFNQGERERKSQEPGGSFYFVPFREPPGLPTVLAPKSAITVTETRRCVVAACRTVAPLASISIRSSARCSRGVRFGSSRSTNLKMGIASQHKKQ